MDKIRKGRTDFTKGISSLDFQDKQENYIMFRAKTIPNYDPILSHIYIYKTGCLNLFCSSIA